jgi:hypothetical protein
MESIDAYEEQQLPCNDSDVVRQRTAEVIRPYHWYSTSCGSVRSDTPSFSGAGDEDGSDDETASASEDDLILPEEAHDVLDPLATSITDEGADEYSRIGVGVQTMTIHSVNDIEDNSRCGISRSLFTGICGTATRLTKERVIVSITVMVLVALIVLIEKMSAMELLDEKRIIQDLTSQILPSAAAAAAAATIDFDTDTATTVADFGDGLAAYTASLLPSSTATIHS